MTDTSDPMGLVNSGTATGAAAGLRQLIMDQLARQERERTAALDERKMSLQEQIAQGQAEDRKQAQADREQAQKEALGIKDANLFEKGLSDTPRGTEISPTQQEDFVKYKRGQLLMPKGIQEPDAPAGIAASPQISGRMIPNTIADSPLAGPKPMIFRGTAGQLDKEKQLQEMQDRLTETNRHNTEVEGLTQQLRDAQGAKPPKEPTPHYQLQPETDPKTGQQTGRFLGFNTLTNSWEPVKGEGPQGTKAAPGAAQNAEHERAKKDALGSLDQLDTSIDDAKDLIGPVAGRYSSLQQMVGSQDPKIQALGTKMLLTKMQVDHAAAGTVRAAASPQLLARWDNILGQKVTPAGLKASVQAMREILGGTAPTPSGKKQIRYDANGDPIK